MCQQTLWKSLLVVGMLIWLVGCGAGAQTALPTAIATAAPAAIFTPEATAPSLPTLLPTATETSTPEATAVFVTAVPVMTPTPVIGPVVNIDAPVAGHTVVMGGELALAGFAQVTSDMRIEVGVTDAAGRVLAGGEAQVDISEWTARLTLPQQVSGGAMAHAVIVDAGGGELARDSVPILLAADRQVNDSYVMLIRPEPGAVGVAGHNFFMDGQLWRQGGGNLQVAVLMNDCQENVADIFFQLGTSSYWQGYVILPRDVEGPACAAAWVGTPGTAEWRAAMMPITILHQDDAAAHGVMISNPRAGRNIPAGEVLQVTGVAYNMPGRVVNIEVLLEENGQVLGEAEDDADFYGYWSAEVALPANASGPAVVRATTGDRAQPDEVSEVFFNVVEP